MYKKSSLNKLLNLIHKITNEESNKWFTVKLIDQLASKVIDKRINSIYELNVKRILNKQANQFYKDFPLNSIKKVLIEDFISMENARREDNFELFCLSCHQQIENIVNLIFEEKNLKEWMMNHQDDLTPVKIIDKENDEKKILAVRDIVFSWDKKAQNPNRARYSYYEKLTVVVYIYYSKHFTFMRDSLHSINSLRNEVHRGTVPTKAQLEKKEKILPKSANYYFIFTGLLANFIAKIEQNYN